MYYQVKKKTSLEKETKILLYGDLSHSLSLFPLPHFPVFFSHTCDSWNGPHLWASSTLFQLPGKPSTACCLVNSSQGVTLRRCPFLPESMPHLPSLRCASRPPGFLCPVLMMLLLLVFFPLAWGSSWGKGSYVRCLNAPCRAPGWRGCGVGQQGYREVKVICGHCLQGWADHWELNCE